MPFHIFCYSGQVNSQSESSEEALVISIVDELQENYMHVFECSSRIKRIFEKILKCKLYACSKNYFLFFCLLMVHSHPLPFPVLQLRYHLLPCVSKLNCNLRSSWLSQPPLLHHLPSPGIYVDSCRLSMQCAMDEIPVHLSCQCCSISHSWFHIPH